MSDSIQFRVRFDPLPVIHDRRALISYREVSAYPQDSVQALRDRMISEIATRLSIPKWILTNAADCNFSSARFDLDRYDRSVRQFVDTAKRRLYLDIKRMAMLRYQIDFYLMHHERLPGSTRTKRLRKKRITVVQSFCERHFRRLKWRYS